MGRHIYLDYAAATPLDPTVLKAMQPYLTDQFYNPSASYLAAKEVRAAITKSRRQVAAQLGAKEAEIIFTAGATEANNLAIKGVVSDRRDVEIVSSAIEHDSILAPLADLEKQAVKVHLVKPAKDGRLDPTALTEAITAKTILVSLIYANNEIGTIEPIKEVAQALKLIRQQRLAEANPLPLYFHTDAAQAANYLDLHVARLGVDLMSLNSGKIYGPKQTGCLYVASHVKLSPLILGGGQERGLRSGTENVANIVGFAAALDLAQSCRKTEVVRLLGLRQQFLKLAKRDLPTAFLNGSLKYRLPNNLNLVIQAQDNERLIMGLDEKGILAAAGSACSASSETPSHVLTAIGLTEAEARASLRLTLGRATTTTDIAITVKALKDLVS